MHAYKIMPGQNVIIKIIPHGSAEYDLMVALRAKLLREPLGLTFSTEELAAENNSIHIAAFQDTVLVGCLVLKPESNHAIIIRQVAVVEPLQHRGIGSAMTVFAEQVARKEGYETILLHAREHAVPFYIKHGYQVDSEEFTEVTIPHYRMLKDIQS